MRRVDKRTRYIYDLREQRIPGSIGNQDKNLRFLISHGFRVLAALVYSSDPGQDGRSDDHSALEQLRIELANRLGQTARMPAVRFSAKKKSAQKGDIS
jgi:hypothetical protein